MISKVGHFWDMCIYIIDRNGSRCNFLFPIWDHSKFEKAREKCETSGFMMEIRRQIRVSDDQSCWQMYRVGQVLLLTNCSWTPRKDSLFGPPMQHIYTHLGFLQVSWSPTRFESSCELDQSINPTCMTAQHPEIQAPYCSTFCFSFFFFGTHIRGWPFPGCCAVHRSRLFADAGPKSSGPASCGWCQGLRASPALLPALFFPDTTKQEAHSEYRLWMLEESVDISSAMPWSLEDEMLTLKDLGLAPATRRAVGFLGPWCYFFPAFGARLTLQDFEKRLNFDFGPLSQRITEVRE